MSGKPGGSTPATAADLLRSPEDVRFHEIVAGEILRKADQSGEHGDAQSAVVSRIKGPYQRRPGGWWIFTEVEVEIEPNELYRPDAIGRGSRTIGSSTRGKRP